MYRLFKLFLLFVVVTLGLAATSNKDKLFEISKNIEIFVQVFREVNANYVEDVDPAELMRIGIDAMVGSLDPYTNYISETQVERYRISDDSKYQGIGASVLKFQERFFIQSPKEGGPAHKAGLRAGDQLISINSTEVKGMEIDEIERNLRGVAGTPVRLTVRHAKSNKVEELSLDRDEVNISNVPYAGIVGDNIGYINLSTFTDNASANITKELQKLKRENENLQGVIIDLRYNGGGLLREAISICNIFLPKSLEIVTTKGKVKEDDRAFNTMVAPEDLDIPVAVLINKKSASASEIVSGVLQDTDRGVIVGQRSYGKGLVQNVFDISYNNKVKVTTSKYYIPSGRCIQGVEYKNGEPVDIPDDKRSVFYTKNKRPVLDGGGVTPDIKLDAHELSDFTQALLDQNLIFEYANQYVLKSDSITDVQSYRFTKIDEFTTWLKSQNFSYKSKGEAELKALEEKIKDVPELKTLWGTELSNLKSKLESLKASDITKHKAEIVSEIEKEIISRYFFEKGKTQISLRNDIEVEEAIKIIKDKERYQKVLKGKK